MAGQGGARAGTIFIFAVTPICFFLISDVAMSTSLSQHADNANIGQVMRPPNAPEGGDCTPLVACSDCSVVFRCLSSLLDSLLAQQRGPTVWSDTVSKSAT